MAAALIHEAVGDQLTCVFVDHGLLRKNEADEVVGMFRDHMNLQVIHADETELFLGELEGQSDPETKRKIIGRLFIDVFQKPTKRSKRWTTFVKRMSNSVDFGVGWSQYRAGFGDIHSNFWL